MTEARTYRALAHVESLEGLSLKVTGFHVSEAMFEIYRLELTMEFQGEANAEALLGKTATLELVLGGSLQPRFFHGVIFGARVENTLHDYIRLTIVVRPRVAQLELGQDNRIFQEMTVLDVVKEVMSTAGLSDAFSDDTTGSYPTHKYIVQRNESDFNFVRRLLSEEGIGFAIRNDLDIEKMHVFDDDSFFEKTADTDQLAFAKTTQLRDDLVLSFRETFRAASDAVSLRDYDLTRPATDLTSETEGEGSTGRQVYLHPGGYSEKADGDTRAKHILERLELHSRTMRGRSTVTHLEPGRTFMLIDHPRLELNGDYFVLATHHRGEGDAYENTFEVAEASVVYRPNEIPTVPVVGGTELAKVTGPGGAELHGSERGQVKVHFMWDRNGPTDDKSSTWLRVGQLQLPGSMVVPRVDFEVLTDFEMGDIDRPFVRGHLYNGEAMPPYELPGGATRSAIQTNTTGGSGGANEIRFEDSAGGEEIFVNASHDYVCSVENNARTGVKANEEVHVAGNAKRTVGDNSAASVGGSRSLTVGGNQTIGTDADLSMGTGGDLSVTVGTRKETCGGDLSESVAGSLTRTVGGLASFTGIAAYNRNIVGDSSTTVGGAWSAITADALSSTCGAVRSETVGALKMTKAKSVAVSCGAAFVQTCAVEKVKAGGNRVDSAEGAIAVTAGGPLKVKAANINISGESKVVFKVGGTLIEVKPSGVKIKSGTIKLKGAKRLTSMNHKST